MKTKMFYVCAAAAVVLSGCVKPEGENPASAGGEAVKFYSWINSQTRASNASWDAGDAIGVFMVEAGGTIADNCLAGNVEYFTPAGNGVFAAKNEPLYYPDNGARVDFVAYYPYRSKVVNYFNGKNRNVIEIDVSDQSVQADIDLMYSDNAKGYYMGAIPMGDVPELNFRHMLAKLVFNVTDLNGTSLEGLISEFRSLCLVCHFDLSEGKFLYDLTGNYPVVVEAHIRSISGSKAVVEAIVLPCTEFDYKLAFRLENGPEALLVMPGTTHEAGKRYTYNVNIVDKTVAVTEGLATITDWNDEAGGDHTVGKTPVGVVTCPAGEVAIEMSEGTVIWAGSNLDYYQTFAENSFDDSCLFQWGYDKAIESASSGGEVEVQVEDSEVTDWNPCPSGWRLPTGQEFRDLINLNSSSYGRGVADGVYTATSWTTGSGTNTGFAVVPKVGDTDKTLWFPNAGSRFHDGSLYGYYSTAGEYWSSTISDDSAGMIESLVFSRALDCAYCDSTASRAEGHSVRCVR